jgi:cytidylate kinase
MPGVSHPPRAVRCQNDAVAPVVTLSASFGSGGSIVGPQVAEQLGLQFLDRAIPVAVAEALAVPMSEVMAHDDRRTSGLGRLFASLARAAPATEPGFSTHDPSLATPAMTANPAFGDQPEQAYRAQTERVLRRVAETEGGVILGRAAGMVLQGHPQALHVRLDGPLEARVHRAMNYDGLDADRARKLLTETDRAREAYVKHFYRCDARDSALYHLVLDSSALDLTTCADLVVTAARARIFAR